MAEYCPKCNYKLRLRDWRPECPNCGVNVVYFGIEDRLREEADVAEYRHAKIQPRFDRLKFSLIGHPLCIVKLVLGILPLLALLLPMGTVSYTLPFGTHSAAVNLISIVVFFVNKGFDPDLFLSLLRAPTIGEGMRYYAVSLVALVLLVLLTLISFFFLVLSFSPKGFRRNIAFPIVGMVLATVAFAAYILMLKALSSALPDVFSGTVNPAAYIVCMVLFLAQLITAIVIKKKGIAVKYTDVSEYLLPYNERPSTKEKEARKAAAAAE